MAYRLEGTPHAGAKQMLDRGMTIFPLAFNSKKPAAAEWQKRRLTSESLLTVYNCNFGVNLGATGHFVVDLDNKDGKNGSAAWADLLLQHGSVPATLTVRTPTGGFHHYFKGHVANSVGKLGAGIDVRGAGGYVVAPGSEINGDAYTIIHDYPIADAPQWLLDALSDASAKPAVERVAISSIDNPSEITRAIAYLHECEEAIEGQGGDSATYRAAVGVRDFGISKEKCFELMLEHYNPRCQPMWEQEELMAKVENAYDYAQNSLGARTVEAATAEAQADFDEVPVECAGPNVNERRIDQILAAGEYKQDFPPPRTEPVLWIHDTGIAKRGDLVVIQAKPKVGKSAVVGAAMAAILGPHDQVHDYLGWRGQNPEGWPLLHFDTEQSPEDHHDLVNRTLDRAGITKAPACLRSFCLTAADVDEALAAILRCAEKQFREHGGIAAIFVDGVGDLCHDLNDPKESNRLVARLYALAIRYMCPVLVVLHENPGSETGKTRGHLGSQLERKAASNLRLEKNEKGVTQLWSERLRRGHIAKGEGPAFVWDKGRNMHVSTLSAKEEKGLDAQNEFQERKEQFLAFLRAQPDLSKPNDAVKCTDLHRRALTGKLPDVKSKNENFVDDAKDYLAGGDTGFNVKKSGKGQTSYYVIERLATAAESLL